MITLQRFIFYIIAFGNFFVLTSREIPTIGTTPIALHSLNQSVASGQAMLIIKNSDQYLIPELFDLKPTSSGVIGILINTDNVLIHFGRNTIMQDKSGGGTDFTAIEIASGKSNITIIGGNITSIDGTGIKIGTNCHDISIINLKINECTKIGLDIDTANNINIENVQITNCDGSDSSVTEAIALKIINCNDIDILNSNFNNNKAANDKDAIGVFLSNCKNCEFIDCEASSNIGGAGTTGGSAFGFKITSTTSACLFNNCDAQNNQISKTKNCHGFFLSYSNDNQFNNCKASSNSATTNTGSPTISGFYLENCTGNSFKNCYAQEQDTSTSSGNAFGFFSSAGKRNHFLNCSASGNTAGTSSSSIGAGFALRNGESRSIIESSFSVSNDGGAGEGYGVMIGFTGDSGTTSNNIVHNNTILNNIGTTKKYGYRDFSSNSTTVLSKNISSAHGAINPGLDQLTLSNNMNYMFTFTGADHEPQLLVEEINLAQVGSTNVLSSTLFVNLSVIE